LAEESTLPKARLFVALPVSSKIEVQVAGLPRKGLDAKWNHPSDLHITLRFIGDIDRAQIDEVADALEKVRRPVFHVEASGFGFFDNPHQVVFWGGVGSGRKLNALVADINDAILPLGFEMPLRAYAPHITLARLKNRKGLDEYIKWHQSRLRDNWEARSFSLCLSGEVDGEGRRYRRLRSYTLLQ
jgi:2'-5' RNA ligase